MSRTTWRSLCNGLMSDLAETMEQMSDAELKLVRSAQKRATRTNVWWAVFDCAPVLSELADWTLHGRRLDRRKAKGKKP